MIRCILGDMVNFNPRSREGSDGSDLYKAGQMAISIHAPARGATRSQIPFTLGWTIFQSTLPRGDPDLNAMEKQISIHAPARGATKSILRFPIGFQISIHAPARGATYLSGQNWCLLMVFQSTLPRGERLAMDAFGIFPAGISIHAPARGATMKNAALMALDGIFQSTLPRGERLQF